MKINLSSIISKLSRGESALVGKKFMKEDMESIYRFLVENKNLIPSELKGYFESNPNKFELFEFIKGYFSIYKKLGEIIIKNGSNKSDLLILS